MVGHVTEVRADLWRDDRHRLGRQPLERPAQRRHGPLEFQELALELVDPADVAAVGLLGEDQDGRGTMRITVLTVPGCPNAPVAYERIRAPLLGRAAQVELVEVHDETEAVRRGMTGAPTVLLDGTDPFAQAGAAPSMSCRIYLHVDGTVDGAAAHGHPRAAAAFPAPFRSTAYISSGSVRALSWPQTGSDLIRRLPIHPREQRLWSWRNGHERAQSV